MSRREHGVLRAGALVVLALAAWLPRSEGHSSHANVAASEPATFTDVRNVSWTAAK